MSLAEFAAVTAPLPKAPAGWEPHVELTGDTGSAVVALPQAGAKSEELLREAGFDPTEYRIKGDISYRKWMRYDQEWLHYYRFAVEPNVAAQSKADVEELIALFKTKPPKLRPRMTGDDAFVFVASDWQIGKGEGGGSAATVDRVRQSIQDARQRVLNLRRLGHAMPTLLLVGTGDLHEGCSGFYAMQTWQVDLDRREQNRVVRRLLREAVAELAPLFDRAIVTGVGGNHGENRMDGKAYTSFADNDDVAALEVVQEAVTGRPDYDHVEFYIPTDELQLCLEVAGVNVGLAHGHQMGKGGTSPQKKAENWWAFQAFGFQPLAKAQILITGHYHHLSVVTYGHRTHLQAPSMDGGSLWFRDQTGVDSPAGTLTLRLDRNQVLGWADLQIL